MRLCGCTSRGFNYGVMSKKLEDLPGVQAHPERRAARGQILEYYDQVLRQHMEGGRLEFFSGVRYDFESGSLLDTHTGERRVLWSRHFSRCSIHPERHPSNTPPRFHYNPRCAHVVPVNSLSDAGSISTESKNQNKGKVARHYVVVGGGKTGQDAVLYLLNVMSVHASDVMWIVPNDFWITARDPPDGNMDTCTSSYQLRTQQQIRPCHLRSTFRRHLRSWNRWEKHTV